MQHSLNLKAFAQFLIISGIVVTGCKRESPEQVLKPAPLNQQTQSMSRSTSNVSLFEPNTMAWGDLAKGYSDLDTRRRHAKLFLSIGLTEVVKNPAIAQWIEAEAPNHEDSVFYFEDLFNHFPQTKAIIERTVDPLGTYTGWKFEEVQQQMQYGEYDIKASIYLASLSNVNNALKPVVTPGSDLYNDAGKGVDIVLGWYIDESNNVSRINLWKEAARAARVPVMVIDGRAKNIKELINREGPVVGPPVPLGDPNPNNFNPNQPPDYANHRISITKYQIGYRYDNNSNSEFEISGKLVYTPAYNSGSGALMRYFLRENGCYSSTTEEYQLASVNNYNADNWIMVNTDRFFCWLNSPVPADWSTGELDYNYVPAPGTPQGYSYQPRKILFFNTYENDDWPSSRKPISPEWVNGVHLDMKGRMENHDEWYQFDPTAGTNTWWNQYGMRLHISQMAIGWNYSMWTAPVKGMLEFKTTSFCNY